jgi:hypothetical protein
LLLLIRADQRTFTPEHVDLSLIAEEATETLLPLAESRGVTIATSGDMTCTIGSHALLLQLSTNLVHNAIVHNLPQQGTVSVATCVHPKSAVLTVENTGEKLTPQLVSTLGEPFRRGTERMRTDHAGVGLGLAIVKSITQAHDGTLTLTPRPPVDSASRCNYPPRHRTLADEDQGNCLRSESSLGTAGHCSGRCAIGEGSAVEHAQTGLELTDDRAENARREKPRPERTGRILTNRRQLTQRSSRRRGHTAKLPADLLPDCIWPVGRGQSSRFGGVRGGAQSVRAHVRDACGLRGRSGGGDRCRRAHLTSGGMGDETAPGLSDAEFATGERPCPGDGIAGAAVRRSFRLEEPQHPLRAVRRPDRDDAPVSLAQCLGRPHTQILPAAQSSY